MITFAVTAPLRLLVKVYHRIRADELFDGRLSDPGVRGQIG